MGYIFAVDEAIEKLITSLSEAIGWKYLKSQRCLKKTVGDLVFEIDFYSSKWNSSHERVEINAGFSMWNKSYDKKILLLKTWKRKRTMGSKTHALST